MKQFQTALLVLCVLMLAACATPREMLTRTDVVFTETGNAAATLVEQGEITPEQAERLYPVLETGNAALDAAWIALAQKRPQTALEYLATINASLAQIIEIVNKQREAKP